MALPFSTEHHGKQPSPLGCWHSLTLNCAYRSPETRPSSGMCRLRSESSSHSLLQREEKARPQERRPPRQRLSGASPVLLSLLKRGALVWPCCMASHRPGSHPLTQRETLPEPYITCCQLSETHRNRPVFFKLADIRTWRNVGGNLKMNSKVSWSPSQPDDVSELFQKKHRWLAEDC